MAFDVLRTPRDNGVYDTNVYGGGVDFTTYNFYSRAKSKYVSVTTREDGDVNSPYETIGIAVRDLNKLTDIPEIKIRDDSWKSTSPREFTFDLRGKPFTRTSPVITKPQTIDPVARNAAKFLLDGMVDGTKLDKKIFDVASILLRVAAPTSTLTDVSQPSIQDILSVDILSKMDTSDVADLQRDVPLLSNYIDFNNVTQLDINAAISGIPDINTQLGIEPTANSAFPTYANLRDKVENIPNINELLGETTKDGVEIFPEGINSTVANFEYYPLSGEAQIDPSLAQLDRITQLNDSDKLITLPTLEMANRVKTRISFANSVLRPYFGKPGSENIDVITSTLNGYVDGFGTTIDGLRGAVINLIDNIARVNKILPKSYDSNTGLTPASSNDDISALLADPLGGLSTTTTEPNAFDMIATVESISALSSSQAKSIGDDDHLEEYFEPANIDSVLGSTSSPTFLWLITVLDRALSEFSNWETTPDDLNNFKAFMLPFIKMMDERVTLEQRANYPYNSIVEDMIKFNGYISDRAANIIPLVAQTPAEKHDLLNAISSWMPGLIAFYKTMINGTMLGEVTAYRQAFNSSGISGVLAKTKLSAQYLNSIATPEFNEAMKIDDDQDDNTIMTTIPLKRQNDDDFSPDFKLGMFISNDVDTSPKRLRNYERDYRGEINIFSSDDIAESFKEIGTKILQPLKDAGFDFTILRGLRPFRREQHATDINNSDHHYGLAVDIKLTDTNLTGIAAAYIKQHLPWNKIIVYNFNEGTFSNGAAFIHISHYTKESHGWDKNKTRFPTGNGLIKVIGGNGIPIPKFNT